MNKVTCSYIYCNLYVILGIENLSCIYKAMILSIHLILRKLCITWLYLESKWTRWTSLQKLAFEFSMWQLSRNDSHMYPEKLWSFQTSISIASKKNRYWYIYLYIELVYKPGSRYKVGRSLILTINTHRNLLRVCIM